MNATQFLEAVWPVQGPFCIGRGPFSFPDGKGQYFKHNAFDTAVEAARFATMHSDEGVFYAIHALKADYTKNANGNPQRRADNMRGARVAFGDLDCGWDDKKNCWKDYQTKDEARKDLFRFCKEVGLPLPMVISSGNGLHIYWRLVDEMDSATWKRMAELLQQLADHHGFKLDRPCTTDTARILRVVGTFNHKDPANPKPVKLLLGPTDAIPNADFMAILNKAAEDLPSAELRESMQLSEVAKPTEADVLKVCPTFRKMEQEAPTARGVVWMATNALALHIKDGPALAHRLASQHPDYKHEQTESKLQRLVDLKMGPPRCGKLEELYGEESPCATCAFYGNPKSSPVVFARRLPKTELPDEIPPPQLPFSRTGRGIGYQGPTVSGVTPPLVIISPYDMYPSMIVSDLTNKTKGILWHAETRQGEWTEFRLPIAIYHDEPRLLSALADNGVVAEKRHAKRLGEYMSHYIRLLQQHAADQAQHESFGWVMPERNEFVYGDRLLTKDGARPAILANGMQNLAGVLKPGGTLEGQIKALTFYNDRSYVRQQFMVLSSLGAVLLYMTDHSGVIINIAGASGASKSTSLIAAASLWGLARKLIMDGNERGATKNGRAGRVRMLANIPVIVDEITLMAAEDMRALAMEISQEGDKVKQTRLGVEQVIPDTGKATAMLCSSNSSMHELMSQHNQAGSATSMRVMELLATQTGCHTKNEADAAIREFREHYGHIGPMFVDFVIKNKAAVKVRIDAIMSEVNRLCTIAPEERFWAAAAVAALVALDICLKLKVLSYDRKHLLHWLVHEQLPQSRQSVKIHHPGEIEILVGYLNSIAGAVLVVSPARPIAGHKGPPSWDITREPRGPILKGRAEVIPGHDQIFLSAGSFKDYCIRNNIPYEATVKVLEFKKVVTREKMDLARHVPTYQSGQERVIRVDLTHELMSGIAPVEADGKAILHFPGKKVLPKPDTSGKIGEE